MDFELGKFMGGLLLLILYLGVDLLRVDWYMCLRYDFRWFFFWGNVYVDNDDLR